MFARGRTIAGENPGGSAVTIPIPFAGGFVGSLPGRGAEVGSNSYLFSLVDSDLFSH